MSEKPIELLLVAKGHAYDRSAFMALFEADRGLRTTLVEQPAAEVVLRPENVAAYDAVLFYDMVGIAMPSPDGASPVHPEPSADYVRSIEALLERGTGIVMLNHGLISWPAWPLWRALSGTSFMLQEGEIAGRVLPGSGYRGGAGQPERNVATRLLPQQEGHPVLAGLDDGFLVTDELYLKTREFEADVLPLLRSDYAFTTESFTPPPLAPAAEQRHWSHPPGSDLVVWANAAGNSPVVASEIGDGPPAYACAGFRRLVGNAVRWVASAEGRRWAKSFSPG